MSDQRRTARELLAGRARRFLDLHQWWRSMVAPIDHQRVVDQIVEESGWSPRYMFMTAMSAGIAVLGLLLASPAVVIGAMLISPLMDPILGFGFSLATFDFPETRRSLSALVAGSALAVAFAALIVTASPLKEPTAEILSRTRPNLFDLLVALFAALAGTFAVIRGKGETIAGVAIATALMPPLAVVGYGLATWNIPVLIGALALFVTNFVTMSLAATVMARWYGFGRALSPHQTWIQTILLILVFVGLSIPLGLSLSRFASQAVIVTEVRSYLSDRFGARSRVTQLAVDFDAKPLAIRSVVVAPRAKSATSEVLRAGLERKLGRAVTIQVDQILLGQNANSLEAQRARLQEANDAAAAAQAESDRVARLVALAAGVPAGDVVVDSQHKQATAAAGVLPGADLETYHALEARAAAAAPGWRIAITPPLEPLPTIRFANGSDVIDGAAMSAILTSAWAVRRWNIPALRVPGLPAAGRAPPRHPRLDQRRALA
ncbi:MAG: TIGR00341 family protein, partial [Caulobacteraceae bacterium]